MRKLNSFIDSKHPFAFLDVNNLPFYHLSVYKTILEKSKKDILFRGKSSKYRTLARNHHSLLNHLDEKIGTGYNCSIILSNPKLDLNSLTINYKDKTIQTKQSKTLLNFKYTGTDLRNIPDKIMEFVKTLKNTNS